MGEFGDNLRRERELRGIALTEISESTKISKRWLKALEDEEFDVLPGGVFNRGFVRAYAHFLGINEEEAVADYITASNEHQPAEDKFPLEIHEKPASAAARSRHSVVPVLLAVMALVLAIGGWTFWLKHKSPESAAASQNSGPVATPSASAPTNSLPPLEKPANTSATPSPQTRNPSEPGEDSGGKKPPANTSVQDQDSATDAEPPVSKLVADRTGAFSVVIKARQASWISIAADGKPFWEGILNANNERAVTAGKELVVKTGNAAGIEVSYNGKALGTLGKDKQVRTLTFNTAGLQ